MKSALSGGRQFTAYFCLLVPTKVGTVELKSQSPDPHHHKDLGHLRRDQIRSDERGLLLCFLLLSLLLLLHWLHRIFLLMQEQKI
jgi:hypothetical protein